MAAPKTEIGSFSPSPVAAPATPSPNGGLKAVHDFMKIHGVGPVAAEMQVKKAEEAAEAEEPKAAAANPVAALDEIAFESAIAAAEQSAELTYEDRVKKFGLTMVDAVSIVDTMLTQGTYVKAYPVTSKIKVTFRTRAVSDNEKMFSEIEENKPAFNVTMSSQISKFNLAASLVSLGNTKFENTPEGREKALKFVSALPAHIFALLVTKLAKFDQMMGTVLEEGAIENF